MTKITPEGVSTANWAAADTDPKAITVDWAGNIYTANYSSSDVTKITRSSYPAPPAKPAAPNAAPGDGRAAVWATPNPPSAANGAPSFYTVTAVEDPTKHCNISFRESSCVVRGLTNGTSYTFTQKANLATWATAASAPSASVTPAAAPAAPTISATPGDRAATITFSAGADNGARITNYEYSTDGGLTWTVRSPSSTVSPVVITGLSPATTYRIALRARSSAGISAPSNVVSVRPASKPKRPSVIWSLNKKTKTVTAVITPISGATYRLAAKSGSKTKVGSCKNVTVKQGRKRVARRSCTIKLAKGTWLVSVTPTKSKLKGTANSKSYRF